jgi:serine protease Do
VSKTLSVVLGTLPADLESRGNRTSPSDEGAPAQDSLDGVEVTDLDAQVRRQFHIPGNVRGALVSNVDEDSNSAEAGLRQGDVLQEIDRRAVNNADDAVGLSKKAKGDRVLLRIWREGGSSYIVVNNRKEK